MKKIKIGLLVADRTEYDEFHEWEKRLFEKILTSNKFEINVLMPLPGTPTWDYALKRGLVSENMSWKLLCWKPGLM